LNRNINWQTIDMAHDELERKRTSEQCVRVKVFEYAKQEDQASCNCEI
jgi:hypothetical protein